MPVKLPKNRRREIFLRLFLINSTEVHNYFRIFFYLYSSEKPLKQTANHTPMHIDDIALTLQPDVGSRTARHLVDCFGSAEAVFAASADELISQAQLREGIAHELVRKKYHRRAQQELDFARKNGINVLAATDDNYPKWLKECADNPHVLYFRGDPNVFSRRFLTIVGTRKATRQGESVCNNIIGDLSRMFPDLVVVSGLAYGIDGACHRAALAFGVPTIGVIANPVMQITPTSNTELSQQMICRGGGVLSEFHSGCLTNGKAFIPRNRIVAGLSLGTLVVESPFNGGSLITAHMADGYNRILMAVPGRVSDEFSVGTNALIKSNKAQMVCTAEDISVAMGWEDERSDAQQSRLAGASAPDLSNLDKDARGLYSCFKAGEIVTIDTLLEISGLAIEQLHKPLLELEFEGLIRGLSAGRYERICN